MRSNHLYSIILAAALVAAATLAPKGNNTRSVDADGHTEWVTGEEIAIYYQTTESENTFATAIADVTANTDGSATFSATLTDAKDGTKAKFIYPASLAKDNGEINISRLKSNQKGTLYDLSANFDAATASATYESSSASL